MNEPAPVKLWFTMRDLLALVAILSIGLALFVPYLQRAREDARRVQCSYNLKQIALTVHGFHDVRQEIVPSYVTDDQSFAALPTGHITWPILMLWALESNHFYELADVSVPLDQAANPPANHGLLRAKSIATYFWFIRLMRTYFHGVRRS